ncbi:MAG: aminotransferase class III-fold pyridoxal phosphate-dependent enzyme [Verrucomicrobia bacterium]|nr:aminotransferase class III-fold pyridoxal phosphate-dependent enzyme [Verrucomicrobiota bacterium]MDA1086418.1 aminotransferase class III-fold pyridoxal phosphate-dependent enzyme [Verrucomicrobiota bacterium]
MGTRNPHAILIADKRLGLLCVFAPLRETCGRRATGFDSMVRRDIVCGMSSELFSAVPLNLDTSRDLLERNAQIIPGGLASINRKADPVIAFTRAQGSRMWDIAGKEYIDYHAGFAPYILGHNDPDQNAAVKEALELGPAAVSRRSRHPHARLQRRGAA